MRAPQKSYERRQGAYERLQSKQKRAVARLSNLRLSTFILGLALSIYLYRAVNAWAGLAAGAVGLALFVYLAVQHSHVRIRLKRAKIMSDLNRKGLERLGGAWVSFPDTGEEFQDEDHPFASDLDLFGQASVFQWICAAHTPLGRQTLAAWLKQPLKDRSKIIMRQEAMAELATKLAWRQSFEIEGIWVKDKLRPSEPLLQWAKESHAIYTRPVLRLGLRALPVLTTLMVALYLAGMITGQVPAALLAGQFLLLWAGGKKRSQTLAAVYRYEASLKTYAEMLRLIEEHPFHASWLEERQTSLKDAQGRSAGEQIKRLATITERISNRENALFFAINLLTLWDYQCLLALDDWKRQSGRHLSRWLDVLAEVEALASLATIRFEHPDWATPTIMEAQDRLSHSPSGLFTRKLGHPLITQQRVANDFELKAPTRIVVVTGSNMSGKSTFLRTVGVNLVLASTGAPVCAEQFSCSLMELWTCMRVSDNLGQSISSFYAEILRIKRIVAAAKSGARVCFLLDEIFKGTNSYDRHQGAKALVNQLLKDGALGLVSTHDLELGDLELDSNGRIKNYHFRDHYENDQIRFDYRLRRGVSKTRNALYLIKMAGIELDEKA